MLFSKNIDISNRCDTREKCTFDWSSLPKLSCYSLADGIHNVPLRNQQLRITYTCVPQRYRCKNY